MTATSSCLLVMAALVVAWVPPAAALDLPGPLDQVPVHGPNNLGDFVQDEVMSRKLGKAFFWDMSAGSDGRQACASCHFVAGADPRSRNQMSPGLLGGGTTFEVGGPNYQLTVADFPFRKLANPADRNSAVLFDSDDVASSMGVVETAFKTVEDNKVIDKGVSVPNPIFNVGGANTRKVEPRNTPTTINSVFNLRNFWDGRANHNFNGVNPFGLNDSTATIFVKNSGSGDIDFVKTFLDHSSLASQAVGPPLSEFEMSWAGRSFPDLGRKLLSLRPLKQQLVDPTDSELGSMAMTQLDPTARGLQTTYVDMIQQTFHPKYWDCPDKFIEFTGSGPVVKDWPLVNGQPVELGPNQYTLMEANFALFWGIAVMMYERTLISDDTPFDRFVAGGGPGGTADGELTDAQKLGMEVFFGDGSKATRGFCVNCHRGPEFTGAAINERCRPQNPQPELVERMFMNAAQEKARLRWTTKANPLPGQMPLDLSVWDPRGAALAIERIATGETFFTGVMGGTAGVCVQGAEEVVLNNEPPAPVDALAEAVLIQTGDCDVLFEVLVAGDGAALNGLPEGDYRLRVDGVERGVITILGRSLYDGGFYNIGVRPTNEDLGVGADGNPGGKPLSFTKLAQMGIDISVGLSDSCVLDDISPNEPTAVNGAFKVPTLRNVELTAPYFHNGGDLTLRQVMEFYNRGGNFQNLDDKDPDIQVLGLSQEEINGLVAFMHALTDERVRFESAPFDHPELFVPAGHPGDHTAVASADGVAKDEFFLIPAVGSAGGAAVQPFLAFSPPIVALQTDEEGIVVDSPYSDKVPRSFALRQNAPNPFNPATTIFYDMARPGDVRLDIYDVRGRKVRTLVNQRQPAGYFEARWDGRDDNGQSVGSGVYLYKLKTARFQETKRMVLVK